MVDKLMMELSKMEEYTGVSVEKIYEVLEKQATVEIIYNVAGIIFIIFLICIGYSASKYFKSKSESINRYYQDTWEIAMIVSMALTLVFVIMGLCIIPLCIGDIIQIIVNKPIWMLEYLTGLIK